MHFLPSPSRYAAAPLISDLICLISYITIAYHIPGTLLRILPRLKILLYYSSLFVLSFIMLLMQLRMLVIVPKYHCSVFAPAPPLLFVPRDPHPCSVVI